MKKNRLKIFAMLCALSLPLMSIAQDEPCIKLESGADFMSRYVWRGTDFGASPSIQPSLKATMGNLTVGTWGAFAVNNFTQFQETDLYITYTLKEKLDITFTDYYFPNETPGAVNNYFEYNDTLTGHVFEGSLKWLGTENLPLTLLVATNFYGADARHNDGSLFYSTYIELGYSGTSGDTEYELFAGFTPNKPTDADKLVGIDRSFYGSTMGFVNLGVKLNREIKITDHFSLPVSTSFMVNPMAENVFLVFGFSL